MGPGRAGRIAAILAMLLGCSSTRPGTAATDAALGTAGAPAKPPSGSGDAAVTYHRDIEPLVAARCLPCHATGGIGPFTLTSLADLTAEAASVRDAVDQGLMPPWQPAAGCQQYRYDTSLTADQKRSFLAWLDAGLPEGDPAATPQTIPTDTSPPIRADKTVGMPHPYVPTELPDEHRCFVLPWNETRTRFVTSAQVIPRNPSIVHHIDVYTASSGGNEVQKEGADGKPGYNCDNAGATGVGSMLTSWIPGGGSSPLSDDESLGLRVDPNAVVIMQVHYHVRDGLPAANIQPDQSSVVLQLVDQVKREGFTVTMTNPLWMYDPNSMLIKAGDANATHTFTASPFLLYEAWTRFKSYDELAVYRVAGHMHLLGKSTTLELIRGGTSDCLLNIPRWDQSWRSVYNLTNPILLKKGDTIKMTCNWDNSASNQPVVGGQKGTPRDVTWNETIGGEMCVGSYLLAPPP